METVNHLSHGECWCSSVVIGVHPLLSSLVPLPVAASWFVASAMVQATASYTVALNILSHSMHATYKRQSLQPQIHTPVQDTHLCVSWCTVLLHSIGMLWRDVISSSSQVEIRCCVQFRLICATHFSTFLQFIRKQAYVQGLFYISLIYRPKWNTSIWRHWIN